MKKESNFRYVLRITFTLLAIAIVVASALAIANQLTAPAIAQSLEKKTQEAIELVLPGGGTEITGFDSQNGMVTKVYQGQNGYAVQVEPIGFDGPITMMVGVGNDSKIQGISIISHTESAGLGAVAADKGPKGQAFRDQLIGQSGSVAVSKDDGTIDSITGATITSRAVCDGVNAALKCVATLQGGAA